MCLTSQELKFSKPSGFLSREKGGIVSWLFASKILSWQPEKGSTARGGLLEAFFHPLDDDKAR